MFVRFSFLYIQGGPFSIGTSLPRGPVDCVSAGVPPHRSFHLTRYDKCDGFFNVQRVCLSFTWDLHSQSYPRDGVFATATNLLPEVEGKARSHTTLSSVLFLFFVRVRFGWESNHTLSVLYRQMLYPSSQYVYIMVHNTFYIHLITC